MVSTLRCNYIRFPLTLTFDQEIIFLIFFFQVPTYLEDVEDFLRLVDEKAAK